MIKDQHEVLHVFHTHAFHHRPPFDPLDPFQSLPCTSCKLISTNNHNNVMEEPWAALHRRQDSLSIPLRWWKLNEFLRFQFKDHLNQITTTTGPLLLLWEYPLSPFSWKRSQPVVVVVDFIRQRPHIYSFIDHLHRTSSTHSTSLSPFHIHIPTKTKPTYNVCSTKGWPVHNTTTRPVPLCPPWALVPY